MKREVIRVEPLSTYLERWKAPTSAITRSGDTIYVSGFPPFDPDTGEVVDAPIERQTEIVLEQMKLCLETAGSSLENVLKCNVYCTSVDKFAAVNAIYSRYFPKDPPARIFVNVPAWPGHFDIEIDCVAASRKSCCVRPSNAIGCGLRSRPRATARLSRRRLDFRPIESVNAPKDFDSERLCSLNQFNANHPRWSWHHPPA
jgi:2-iminobutanoate/2-iminopropanoate deaminase